MNATQYPLYLGTYTRPEHLGKNAGVLGRADGVYRYRFDEVSGDATPERLLTGVANPSYLALTRDGRRLYCVQELDRYEGAAGGAVSGWTLHADGIYAPLGIRPTLGGAPCHLALHPGGALLCVSNYGGGSLAAFPLDADGGIGPAQLLQHVGSGPNTARQASPHVHSALYTPSARHLLCFDLGTDTLTAYPVEPNGLDAAPARSITTPPGAGPRMACYDSLAANLYVLCELSSTLAVFSCDTDGLPVDFLREVSTLPNGAPTSGNTAADLCLSADGRFLYASNRGHDSLSVFSVAEDPRVPVLIQSLPCGGLTPRAFTLSPSGRWLLCGNQDSDTVSTFAVDTQKGALTPHGAFAVPSPVCLLFGPSLAP